jgi:hypothetical protein
VAKSSLDDGWPDFSVSSFSERDADVLNLISQEALSRFTFDGLKRRLGLHSETLSRILYRLEQEGFVEKGSEGYTVTQKISGCAAPRRMTDEKSRVPLLQTLIPSNVPAGQLVKSLSGKWLGLLRWLGFAEGEDSITLKWITEDGNIQVDTNISDAALTIEAKFLHDEDLNMALKASYQLMAHISKLCSRPQLLRHVGYFSDYDLHLAPA